MKHVLVLALCCVCSLSLKAQKDDFKVGVFFNPTYSDRFNVKEDLLRDRFVGDYAYSVGIFVQKQIARSFDVRFGMSFVNNGERFKRAVDNNSGFIEPVPPLRSNDFQIISDFYNLEAPIDIQWFMNKKRNFFTIFGVSPSYSISKSAVIDLDNNGSPRTFKTGGDNGIALALEIGMGYRKALNQNLLLEIQPKFRYYITKIDNSRAMYNAGLQMSMIF
ncbi:MAG: hypothetical protein RL329_1563 [Bacteroidota bacterium]|jgi:hypothetical protein